MTGKIVKLLLPIVVAAGLVVAFGPAAANAFVEPGTAGKDVHIGRDNNNAANPFIQPPGVTAKQHMDNTDLLFGREDDDLLVGRLGSDTLLGGDGNDILVGGPENFTSPNSDVIVGDTGDDINIWSPGDGSDVFTGNEGYDTSIFAPLATASDGSLVLTTFRGRQVPHVKIDGLAQFSCTIVFVPAEQQLGVQYLVRFNVNGNPVITVGHKDAERVLCPSAHAGYVNVAYLVGKNPTFKEVPLARLDLLTYTITSPAKS